MTVRSENHRHQAMMLRLCGELDLAATPLLREAFDQVERERPRRIVLDLGGLSFIDAAGVHLILSEYERLSVWHRPTLEIRRGRRAVQHVFELTGVEDHLPFVAEVAA